MKAIVALLLGTTFADPHSWKQVSQDWESLNHVEAWESWKAEFGKNYNDVEEDAYRFLQFLDNWKEINEHNSGDSSYTLGLNQFGDLSLEEFQYHVHGKHIYSLSI